MKKDIKITREMTIQEIIEHYPEVLSVFINHGLHCIGCPLAQGETVEQAAKAHKVHFGELLEDLNKAVKK